MLTLIAKVARVARFMFVPLLGWESMYCMRQMPAALPSGTAMRKEEKSARCRFSYRARGAETSPRGAKNPPGGASSTNGQARQGAAVRKKRREGAPANHRRAIDSAGRSPSYIDGLLPSAFSIKSNSALGSYGLRT
jgi:hypothetical protein